MRVLRVLLVVLGVGALGGVLLPLLVAGDAPVTSGAADTAPLALGTTVIPSASPSEKRAVRLLRRAAMAGKNLPYSGTQYVTSWSRAGTAAVIVQVQHLPDRGMVVRIEGGPTEQAQGGRGAAMVTDPPTAGIDRRALAALERHYVLRIAGAGHCAGRLADIVQARRASTKELTAQFWIDRATGLLLRRELYDSAGHTIRAAAFVQLDLGPPNATAPREDATSAHESNDAYLNLAELRRFRRAGWTVPDALPDGLQLYDARIVYEQSAAHGNPGDRHGGDRSGHGGRGGRSAPAGADRQRVLHLTYSDGLFTISVFEQRGRLDTARFSGWDRTLVDGATVYTQPGLSERAVWSGGDRVYTVVADAPDAEVARTVAALPHAVSSDGFISRVHRGLSKIAAWFN